MNDSLTGDPEARCDADDSIVEQLPVAYLEINTQGVITRANRSCREMHPLENGQLVGKVAWDFMPIGEGEMSRSAFLATIATGEEPAPILRTIYARNGEFRVFELHRSLIRDECGNIAGMRAISFDVTELHLAYRKADEARIWLEAVVDSIAEAVLVVDALGMVRSFNPAAEELLGWKAAEAIGRTFEERLPLTNYSSATGGKLDHRVLLEERTKGVADARDREGRSLRVRISTAPMIDKRSGATLGTVLAVSRIDESC
jgi:PAS domain S-box-containing protein